MYNIYDKLWGDDITNSLIWIFIRTGQEMFSEKMWNFKMSQLPYFLSDFHHFCTNLHWGNFYSFFWNYVNSGLDFPFKIEYLRRYFVYKFQDGWAWGFFSSQQFWNFEQNVFFKFHFRLPSHKITTIIVFLTHTIRIFVWITQKLFHKSGI